MAKGHVSRWSASSQFEIWPATAPELSIRSHGIFRRKSPHLRFAACDHQTARSASHTGKCIPSSAPATLHHGNKKYERRHRRRSLKVRRRARFVILFHRNSAKRRPSGRGCRRSPHPWRRGSRDEWCCSADWLRCRRGLRHHRHRVWTTAWRAAFLSFFLTCCGLIVGPVRATGGVSLGVTDASVGAGATGCTAAGAVAGAIAISLARWARARLV